MIFGSRLKDGYKPQSLKQVFNDLQNVVGSQQKTAWFKTDRGSRYGIDADNARALLLHKSNVMKALRNGSHIKRAVELLEVIQQNWSTLSFQMLLFSMVYYTILNPFHSSTSKNIRFGEVKTVIAYTESRIKRVISVTSDPIAVLGEYLRSDTVSDKTAALIPVFDDIMEDVTPALAKEMETLARNICVGVLWKFNKDTDFLLMQPYSDSEIIPLTNRRVESSFGCFKKFERRFISMCTDNLCQKSQSKINKIFSWMQELVIIR